ncbi:MAG TPA: hypothetical protein GXZ64_03825 [Clostridiaceae bacterium]|nr:hypothetical protein [Clostridiaceae bacterium]
MGSSPIGRTRLLWGSQEPLFFCKEVSDLNAYASFGITDSVQAAADRAEAAVASVFDRIEQVRQYWQLKTIRAFQTAAVAESAYQSTTGYGYSDRAREQTEAVFAHVFDAEEALVRVQFSSGTHVLATMLRGLLTAGDHLVIASGTPYDTLLPLLGMGQADRFAGTLPQAGVAISTVPLRADGSIDVPAVVAAVSPQTKVVYVQKSRGYSARPALSNEAVKDLRNALSQAGLTCDIAVDFCYCEYVEEESPLTCGANIIAGSLIKNPGAGIAPGGGYIAGDARLLRQIEAMLTAPGVGAHIGPQLGLSRLIQQGFYFAPRVVAEAMKSAVFAAALFQDAGFAVSPLPGEARSDIVQQIELASETRLIRFCEAVQKAAPVDSFVAPVPAPMPGYDCDIIMASGAFISGSSIELSADGPLRPPYAVFLQGGLSYENGRLAAMLALEKLSDQENA